MSVIGNVEEQVRARIAELEPVIAEYRQLQEILATFVRASSPAPRTVASEPATGAKRGRTRPALKAKAKARAAGGRAEEALTRIAEKPGITVAELAEQMSIGPTYLYRVLPALEREGRLLKEATGYHPVSQADLAEASAQAR